MNINKISIWTHFATVGHSQAIRTAELESWIMDALSIDESDWMYQSYRSGTTTGMEVGSLVAGGYGAVKGVIGFGKLARMPTKISRMTKAIRAVEGFQGELLNTHLTQLRKYGSKGYRQLPNGRVRYYGELKAPMKEGEMIGRRRVREWNPETGLKRTWHETVDANGNVRIVRPETNDGIKTHYVFDSDGNFIEIR